MNVKTTGPSPRLKALSERRQRWLESYWNTKLKDPYAMVPAAKLQELSLTDARMGKEQFGKSASGYVNWVIRHITDNSDVERRIAGKKKLLAVGYGRGHGYKKWPQKAVKLGLQTWCVDVSSTAWIWATTDLGNQFSAMRHTSTSIELRPQVVTHEIQSLLADPSVAELDMSSVEICYLCRLLNCLSTRSAKIVLQEIGRTMFSSVSDCPEHNAVIIINALCDDNTCTCCECCGTSIVRSEKMILANLSYGAGCAVESRFVRHWDYFGKDVTARTIMVKS